MASLKQLTAGGSCREVSKFTCMSVCSSFFQEKFRVEREYGGDMGQLRFSELGVNEQ